MDDYRRYLAAQRRTRLLYAVLAWLCVILGGIGLAILGYMAFVGFMVVFGGLR